jgi:hypothetical protein
MASRTAIFQRVLHQQRELGAWPRLLESVAVKFAAWLGVDVDGREVRGLAGANRDGHAVIMLRSDLAEADAVSILAHELAHHIHHDGARKAAGTVGDAQAEKEADEMAPLIVSRWIADGAFERAEAQAEADERARHLAAKARQAPTEPASVEMRRWLSEHERNRRRWINTR